MSIALTTFRATVANLIQDSEGILSNDQIDEQIKNALAKYSREKPDEVVAEFSGDGGKYYSVASKLSRWEDGFSVVLRVEYPAADVSGDEEPQMLEDNEWTVFEDANGKWLYFPNYSPKSTENVRVWYTAPYQFSGSPEAVDVPSEDFYAICELAASLCCWLLASYCVQKKFDFEADGQRVKRGEMAKMYRDLAQRYEASYRKHLKLQEGLSPGAATADWDVTPRGLEYLFHPSWRR